MERQFEFAKGEKVKVITEDKEKETECTLVIAGKRKEAILSDKLLGKGS